MNLSEPQKTMLQLLAQGNPLTGTQMADQVGLSASSISKQVQKLKLMGVPIVQKPGKGYRLEHPLVLLDADAIRQSLSRAVFDLNPPLYVLGVIDSTNLFLKQPAHQTPWAICCSERQNAGRGRLGRSWNSPFGQNIYCSINWRFRGTPQELSGLSLAVSLALHRALTPLIAPETLHIKWPNDLIWKGRKLAGVLIETHTESEHETHVIIGFGININTPTNSRPLSDNPHCALYDIKAKHFDRNPIVAACVNQLHTILEIFQHDGLEPLMPFWKEHDILHTKAITIYQQYNSLHGTARGVNSAGHLLLETASGQILEVTAGDASLKK